MRADTTHFTWWGIALYMAFLASVVAGGHRYTWFYTIVVQAVVILGVVAMSLAGCSVLTDTAHDMGEIMYIAGNFALHYWPTLGTVLRRPQKNPVRPGLQGAAAALTFLVYCTAKRPNAVYGCIAPYPVVVIAGYSAAIAVPAIASSHEHVARHWGPF